MGIPTSRPGSMPGAMFSTLLTQGAVLLGACVEGLDPSGEAEQGGSTAAALASQAEVVSAGWHLAQLLPRLAASLSAELRDPLAHAAYPGGVSEWLRCMSVVCANLTRPLALIFGLPLGGCSPAQLATWAEAVTASLRLLPCMATLNAQLQQLNEELRGAQDWCDELVEQLQDNLPCQLQEVGQQLEQLSNTAAALPAKEAAAWTSLSSRLWALHTALCRLIAALAAPAAPLSLLGARVAADEWRGLLLCLNLLLLAMVDAHRAAQRPPEALRPVYVAALVTDAAQQ